ncbi:uncharacterized protein LOC116251548 isoform X2 [Nymphaea colorata]|uniref:uncharacterized protein LOC116251548 isoform X2 n=1 Tax=Nymphaea colorata TaxID=210225 RepID=UPI00129D8886|nr:uncharacterized protein LOC116251548 isoform X2 [Nymphaea colorata]
MGFNRFGTFEPSRSLAGSFFTNEAIRGYITSGLAGNHVIGRHLSSREALRWEIEKDKIRAEMIADIIRRRQLEEEVRRELALEREMVLRQELQLLDSLNSAAQDVKAENRFCFGGKSLPKSGVAVDPLRPEAGSSSEPALADPRAAVEKPVVFPVNTLNDILRGTKRKVPAPPAAAKGTDAKERELPWLAIPRKKTKIFQSVWTCNLCHISCTSRDSLAHHHHGKKHKAKLEESRLQKEEGPSDKIDPKKPRPSATEAAGVTDGGLVIGAAENLNLKKTPGSKKQLKGKSVEPKPKNQKVKKKGSGFMFRCEHCGVGCNSEAVLDSHLKGKKHAAKLEELKISGDASVRAMPVKTFSAKETVKTQAATGMQEEDGSVNEGEEVLEHEENKGVDVAGCKLVEQKENEEVQVVAQKENERIEVAGNEVREQKENERIEVAGNEVREQKENERIEVAGNEVREQKEDGEVDDAGNDVEEEDGRNWVLGL